LVAGNNDIQTKLAEMRKEGTVLQVCIARADSYDVTDRLRELGLDVKPIGKPLSEIIKDKSEHLVTF
jgi:hypothetical protein